MTPDEFPATKTISWVSYGTASYQEANKYISTIVRRPIVIGSSNNDAIEIDGDRSAESDQTAEARRQLLQQGKEGHGAGLVVNVRGFRG